MANYWYSYQGGSGTAPTLNPANYLRVPNKPQSFCEGAGQVCAIYAPATNNTKPGPFSSNLETYIASATAFDQPSTGKLFVYVKNL